MYKKFHAAILASEILISTGCGQARFRGSAADRIVKREAIDAVSASVVTKSEDQSYDIMDFNLALLAAPHVKIGRLETFNSRLFALLQCESKLPEGEKCAMGGDSKESFALGDIHIRLLAVSSSTPLTTQLSYDRLERLDFSEVSLSRPANPGEGIELGPLSMPPLVGGQRMVIIARQVFRIDNVEYATFRIFLPTQ